jgi:magnesium transporter
MDAFASVISNNLNIVMKFLATVTIVMSVPTMIASFFGMNVGGMPFLNKSYGFVTIIIITLLVTSVIAMVFRKKDLF